MLIFHTLLKFLIPGVNTAFPVEKRDLFLFNGGNYHFYLLLSTLFCFHLRFYLNKKRSKANKGSFFL